MKPCKRVEIVIEQAQATALLHVLDQIGVPGYTVLPNARGSGDRGLRSGDELTGVLTNSVIVIACQEEILEDILAAVRPAIQRSGGACLISDAVWLSH
ncbi:MAG: transcriptional regulator [Gammaproteobacteria bacterium]|jgi:nitrogen regulatory protein PII